MAARPVGWFSVDSWSRGDPVVIDPYAQDGLFPGELARGCILC